MAVMGQALTQTSFLSTVDKERLQRVFDSAWPLKDLPNAYYSIFGLTLLEKEIPKETEACAFLKMSADIRDTTSLYYASSAAALLPNGCAAVMDLSSSARAGLESLLNEAKISLKDLYQVVITMKNLKLKINEELVKTALNNALKGDSSATTVAYAFHLAQALPLDQTVSRKLAGDAKDVVEQADETNSKHLFYEDGLWTTAFVVEGLLKVGQVADAPLGVAAEKLIKFAEYLLSRRYIHQVRAAAQLTAALKALGENKRAVPVAVTLASSVAVTAKSPNVQVQVSTVWGKPIPNMEVVVDSAKQRGTEATFVRNEPLTPVDGKPGLYQVDILALKTRPTRGFYQLTLTAKLKGGKNITPDGCRLLAATGAPVEIKVMSAVTVEKIEVGIADRDQTASPRTTKLQYPVKAATVLEGDSHQRLLLNFQLRERDGDAVLTAHQAFVRLVHSTSGAESIFVAEPDKNKQLYKFNLDLSSKAKDLNYDSGRYAMQLVIGDALIENPLLWNLADIELQLPSTPETKAKRKSQVISQPSDVLPEIFHQFRKPERRASQVVAMSFTFLCLAPLLLLLGCWAKLGLNLRGLTEQMSTPFSTIGFHAGLAAILALYGCYFHSLDMFSTLQWLALLGIVTFLCGNSLLHSIAAKRFKSA